MKISAHVYVINLLDLVASSYAFYIIIFYLNSKEAGKELFSSFSECLKTRVYLDILGPTHT
jgi:hypothetical protein